MGVITPTEAEMIADAIESALLDVHVALPAMIQSYNAATQTATVELQVHRMLRAASGRYVSESLPVLENVPVQFPRTRNFILTFPLAGPTLTEPGDFGLVVFSESSIDQWRSKADNTSPGDIARHTLSGAVFQPGFMPNDEAIGDDISEDLVLGEIAGVQVRIKPGGIAEVVSAGGPTASDFVAMNEKVIAAIQAMADEYDDHTHLYIPGNLAAVVTDAPVTGLPVPSDVASTNLKADG